MHDLMRSTGLWRMHTGIMKNSIKLRPKWYEHVSCVNISFIWKLWPILCITQPNRLTNVKDTLKIKLKNTKRHWQIRNNVFVHTYVFYLFSLFTEYDKIISNVTILNFYSITNSMQYHVKCKVYYFNINSFLKCIRKFDYK